MTAGPARRLKQFTYNTGRFEVAALQADKVSLGKLSPPLFTAVTRKLYTAPGESFLRKDVLPLIKTPLSKSSPSTRE